MLGTVSKGMSKQLENESPENAVSLSVELWGLVQSDNPTERAAGPLVFQEQARSEG